MSTQRELLERSLDVIKLFVPSYGLLIEEIEAELAKPEPEIVCYRHPIKILSGRFDYRYTRKKTSDDCEALVLKQ